MPVSNRTYDRDIRTWVYENFPRRARVLDVGAGMGKYRDLLIDFPHVYAVEIEPRPGAQLEERYEDVWVGDFRDLTVEELESFDLVIMGDVLEHVSVQEAQAFLSMLDYDNQTVLIAVPFEFPQGEVDGNPHERHIQDDLTHQIFHHRYGSYLPNLSTLALDETYGVYVAGVVCTGAVNEASEVKVEVPIEKLRQNHVVVLTPCYGGNVSIEYLRSVIRTQAEFFRHGMRLTFITMENASHIDRARNDLVARGMAVEGMTHMLFIDADQGWEPMAILKLLALERDFIGVPVRKKVENFEYNLNFLDMNHHLTIERGAIEVREIGTGFLLLARGVIERLEAAYPELFISASGEAPEVAKHHFAFFDAKMVEEGAFISEDLAFCRLWRAIGGQVWIDHSSSIVHVGRTHYAGALSSVMRKEG